MRSVCADAQTDALGDHLRLILTVTVMQNGVGSPLTSSGSYSHCRIASTIAALKAGNGGFKVTSRSAQTRLTLPVESTRVSPTHIPLAIVFVPVGMSGKIGRTSRVFFGTRIAPPIRTGRRFATFVSRSQRPILALPVCCSTARSATDAVASDVPRTMAILAASAILRWVWGDLLRRFSMITRLDTVNRRRRAVVSGHRRKSQGFARASRCRRYSTSGALLSTVPNLLVHRPDTTGR